MTLWTSNVSGWPGSVPTSPRMGMRPSPHALSCSCESQPSLPRTCPSARKHTWSSSPSGGKSPASWRRRIVSSYWSVLVAPGGAKRIRTLMAVLHGPGGRRRPYRGLARRAGLYVVPGTAPDVLSHRRAWTRIATSRRSRAQGVTRSCSLRPRRRGNRRRATDALGSRQTVHRLRMSAGLGTRIVVQRRRYLAAPSACREHCAAHLDWVAALRDEQHGV